MSIRWCSAVACFFGLLAVAGCGQDEAVPAPVHGRVFYKGVPLSGGSIVFTPDIERGGSGPLARGDIGPDGRYVLNTDGRAGAAPGWHRVTIVAIEGPPTETPGTPFTHVHSLLPRSTPLPTSPG